MPTDINIVAVPSLSEDGWVFSSNRQADYLMAYFLASDKSQSYIHDYKQISSFAWLVTQYGNDPVNLMAQVKTTLEQYFSRYFNNVVVECSDQSDKVNEPSLFILGLYVEFQTADGVTSNISQLTQISGSKFQVMSNLISNGPGV